MYNTQMHYRTYPYKRSVKQFLSVLITRDLTACVLLYGGGWMRRRCPVAFDTGAPN